MEKTVKVSGMNCSHCAGKVGAALEMVEGVTRADVSLEAGTARIEMDREVQDSQIASAVAEMGYEVVAE